MFAETLNGDSTLSPGVFPGIPELDADEGSGACQEGLVMAGSALGYVSQLLGARVIAVTNTLPRDLLADPVEGFRERPSATFRAQSRPESVLKTFR